MENKKDYQNILEYTVNAFLKFIGIKERFYSTTACEKSNHLNVDHFSKVGKMVEIGSRAKRKQADYELSSRCYR